MRKVILIFLFLGGCTQVPMLPTLTPYKIDIQQGNYVTQEMVAKLKPGMTRPQVRFILGTPLVVDPFRTDRWDYVYLYNKGGAVTEQRRIAVIFKNDKLERIEGDVVPAKPPAALEGSASGEPPKRAGAQPQPQAGAPDQPQASKPAPVAPVASEPPPAPQGAVLTTTSGDPVQSGSQPAEPAKAESSAEKPKQQEPQEEKGFFGRMLEKLGF